MSIDEASKCLVRGWNSRFNARFIVTSAQLSMRSQDTMDVFHHRYYRLNKILMTVIGQWPYQTVLSSRCYLGIVISFCTLQVVPQTLAIVKYRNDLEMVFETLSPFMVNFVCSVKLINCLVNWQKILTLLNRIGEDWKVWSHDREVIILHEYAETGRKLTIMYTVVIYGTVIVFMTQPIVPKMIDVLFHNGTEEGVFPLPVYYPTIDQQKHYFKLVPCSIVGVSTFILITIANDTMFIVFAQHACGLFAALGHKLQRLGTVDEKSIDGRDVSFGNLATCVDRHNDAIEFANLMEATYSGSFFFLLGLNMVEMSISGLQITMKTDSDPQDTIRFIIFVGAELVHLYIESYISQILMDHSISIRDYVHNGKWYNLSLKSQMLLNFMTMRCNVPCKLTAGKICVMSIETFGMVLKTSVSYFTLLRSIQ